MGKAEIETTEAELTTAKEDAITAIGKGYPRLSYLQMVKYERKADAGLADADIDDADI